MKCFVDTSVLIEHIKGRRTDILPKLIAGNYQLCISPIISSEFIYNFIGLVAGKSPLSVKESKKIGKILQEHNPAKFLEIFRILPESSREVRLSIKLMSEYNLLPNDALILAVCRINKIKYLSTLDSDLLQTLKQENIHLPSSQND